MRSLVFVVVIATVAIFAIPNPNDKKSHVVNKKLSDLEHEDNDGHHNPEFDHEAFLGKEDAQKFDSLSPEESKRRLGILFDKIDKNHDGSVDTKELTGWMHYVQTRYSLNDARAQYKQMGLDESASVDYAKYIENNYGSDGWALSYYFVILVFIRFMRGQETNELEDDSTKDDIAKDKRRWDTAVAGGDVSLTLEKFRGFLHPEDTPSMHSVVIQETLDDIDVDKDDKISLKEYLADLSEDDAEENISPNGDSEDEKEFAEEYDKNGDGYLTGDEIKNWIIPDDYNHISEESEHLFSEADANKDALLSRDEVVNNYKLFVGSQATDYGEAIERHDEF